MYLEDNQNRISSRRKIRKIPVILLVLIILGLVWFGFFRDKNQETQEQAEKKSQAQSEEVKAPEENLVEYIISEGDIPSDVFSEYGKMSAIQIQNLLDASKEVYDFSNLKIGQKIQFIFNQENKLQRIRYYLGTEKEVVAEVEGESFKVRKEDIPYEVKVETAQVKIDEFLYKDALDAGLSEGSILEVADIFSFDIDFTTEIQAGDEVKIIYEKRTLKGKPATDGKILAAKFINSGQEYFAYYFESNGEGSHYDSEGKELVRQFLRAPLSYRRISSGYTGARYHPITKTVTAHYQIDYAAPSGTPVVATARGTVVSAGWEGGWGNMVRLRHDNGYTTHYGHLSAYGKGIRSGTSVSQGQVVGYVGSTGWSTGPHLDYGLKLNGAPVNPLSLKLPKGTPLEGTEREKFLEIKANFDEKLK